MPLAGFNPCDPCCSKIVPPPPPDKDNPCASGNLWSCYLLSPTSPNYHLIPDTSSGYPQSYLDSSHNLDRIFLPVPPLQPFGWMSVESVINTNNVWRKVYWLCQKTGAPLLLSAIDGTSPPDYLGYVFNAYDVNNNTWSYYNPSMQHNDALYMGGSVSPVIGIGNANDCILNVCGKCTSFPLKWILRQNGATTSGYCNCYTMNGVDIILTYQGTDTCKWQSTVQRYTCRAGGSFLEVYWELIYKGINYDWVLLYHVNWYLYATDTRPTTIGGQQFTTFGKTFNCVGPNTFFYAPNAFGVALVSGPTPCGFGGNVPIVIEPG